MKKIIRKSVFCLFVLALSSCGTSDNNGITGSDASAKKEIITVNTTANYNLVAEGNEVTWDRYLHQGPTTKKIKIFGADAEVELGEVELNTSGDVSMNSGILNEYNDSITDLTLFFDMTTIKLNTDMEKGDDLFKANEFGSSELRITEVVKDSIGYILKGELEIASVSNPITVQAQIESTETGKKINGDLVIQTLDWPLRDASAKKSVIKDEITIKLNLQFEAGEVQEDSVITYE